MKSGVVQLFKETFREFSDDKAPRLAAGLAYYTLFSIAPLLVVAIAVAGMVFGREAVRGELAGSLSSIVGPTAARAVQGMIAGASNHKRGIVATVLGVITLLFGASGVFGHLKDTLNTIWGVKEKKGQGILKAVRGKFLSFAMVLGVGFMLLASLVVSAGLSAMGKFFSSNLPGGETLWEMINFIVSFIVITFLFAAIFRFVPDARVLWRDVWVGASFTAFLFVVGKFVIGLYLGRGSVASAYGAAASLVILLIWLYYSGMILFFGAEFTEVFARLEHGSEGRRQTAGSAGSRLPAFAGADRPPPPPRRERRNRGVLLPLVAGVGGICLGMLIGAVAALFEIVKGARKLIP